MKNKFETPKVEVISIDYSENVLCNSLLTGNAYYWDDDEEI